MRIDALEWFRLNDVIRISIIFRWGFHFHGGRAVVHLVSLLYDAEKPIKSDFGEEKRDYL
jgi:hypothetical protein